MTYFLDKLLVRKQMHVGFTHLLVCCVVGTLPEEQNTPQEIGISLKVAIAPTVSDELASTVDYTALAALCEKIALARAHQLLETLASEILEAIFAHFSVSFAWIRLEKPSALRNAQCAFVEFERGQR